MSMGNSGSGSGSGSVSVSGSGMSHTVENATVVADHRISGKIGVAGRVASVRVGEEVLQPLVAGGWC